MPALALAQKVLGKAEKVGVTGAVMDAATADPATGDAEAAEGALGEQLLAIVADARGRGLDAERALRGAVRRLQGDIRAAE